MKPESLLSRLRNDFKKCLSHSCRKVGCSLAVASFSRDRIAIIDCDKYIKCHTLEGKLCDYIVFWQEGDISLAVAELKGGLLKAETAVKQIMGGLKLAAHMADGYAVARFYPVLLYRRGPSAMESKTLRKRKVSFGGKRHFVIAKRCGAELRAIMDNTAER